MQTIGYAAKSAKAKLEPFEFSRRSVGDDDVLIEILYVGICHSDIHQVNDDWGGALYPMVPGHEIVSTLYRLFFKLFQVGKVTQVGSKVSKVKVGDFAGVGCMVDSCRQCENCKYNFLAVQYLILETTKSKCAPKDLRLLITALKWTERHLLMVDTLDTYFSIFLQILIYISRLSSILDLFSTFQINLKT